MDIEIFFKFVLNGLIAGSLYAVLAMGLALLYGVLRVVNLAHGELALTGAYSFYVFYILLGWPLIPSLLAGLSIFSLIILIIERLTFRPVREAPNFIPLIITIGLGLFLKNLLSLIFEIKSRSFNHPVISFSIFSEQIRITDIQIIILITSILLMAGLWMFLKRTKTGRAIRALADNKEAAAILGIPVNRIITLVFLIAGLFAAIAGILAGFDQNIHPNLGTNFTIKSFAAVILGGIGSIPGAVLGAYFIGLAENVLIAIPINGWYIPTSYKDAIAFAALVAFLYFKPSGFFGAKKV